MKDFEMAGKPVALFPGERPDAPLVIVNGEDGEGKALWAAVKAVTGADFALAAVGGLDWDAELTPWPASGIRRGQAFGGQADSWLNTLTGQVLPQIRENLMGEPRWVGLAGYSLAGLFAAWSAYRTDTFSHIASVSGSLWYPGFASYAASNVLRRAPERAYFSVGDREARARNPVMQAVEEATRQTAARFESLGVLTRFELNPGGHFDDPLGRMAKGIAWLLE